MWHLENKYKNSFPRGNPVNEWKLLIEHWVWNGENHIFTKTMPTSSGWSMTEPETITHLFNLQKCYSSPVAPLFAICVFILLLLMLLATKAHSSSTKKKLQKTTTMEADLTPICQLSSRLHFSFLPLNWLPSVMISRHEKGLGHL